METTGTDDPLYSLGIPAGPSSLIRTHLTSIASNAQLETAFWKEGLCSKGEAVESSTESDEME